MTGDRDPIQRAAGEEMDLYDVVTWEERTVVDRASTLLYRGVRSAARALVVLLAVLIVLAQFVAAAGLVFVNRPVVAGYVFLSVVPALGLAVFIWRTDVTMQEPLELLVVTFALGFLFAGFAAILNSVFSGFFMQFASPGAPALLAFAAPAVYFFVVVGPVEETVKWLAVRLYAYRSSRFDAVVDGAVYGAMAGLGFATIENAIYIAREVLTVSQAASGQVIADVALQTAAVRTLAGPGHVIYSAFAGYYLGLAKFNPENRGPIVVKGILIAALIHGAYNTTVTNIGVLAGILGIGAGVAFLAFVIAYDGVLFYLLYRKLSAYRDAYVDSGATFVYDDEDELAASEDAVESAMSVDSDATESER
ncbi:PrsW family intramembrane metalloprotease [Halobacterium zhouii]|uniref:PrsW family intramembrane metalloprotease n=1 Tax=Halobacterium zhouii TaxID=2902624 RepID=UPI001E3095DD|nr:PrsW family intramembrane metalloprotease [Halobacterium zhouii]